MSQEQPDNYSSPASTGRLFFRVLLAALAIGGVCGVIMVHEPMNPRGSYRAHRTRNPVRVG